MPTMITRGAASARAFGLFANLGAYTISRSVRFRASASAYFTRTPSVAGNRKTWTFSAWVKRGGISASTNPSIFGTAPASGTYFVLGFAGDVIRFEDYNGAVTGKLATTQVFRDPSAWYHIVAVFDTTNATANDRMRLYVNGVRVTAFSTNTTPALNLDGQVNNTAQHSIGAVAATYISGYEYDGYMTEINFIDGQALTASSFGQYNTLTGVWQPIRYVGTYGTNGFYVNFSDNSAATAAAIGKDYSGNGNNWTPNNISVTAGTTYDSMIDVPTPYTDGTSYNRGNYAVFNPLSAGSTTTISGANLNLLLGADGGAYALSTMAVSSGKWYWEVNITTSTYLEIGAYKATAPSGTAAGTFPLEGSNGICWYQLNGAKYGSGFANTAYGSTYANGDICAVALDMDAGTITCYKNGVSQGVMLTGMTGFWYPAFGIGNVSATSTISVNFGQRPFTYTPPSGHVALNTYNLSAPTIAAGASYMQPTLYTGNGTTTNLVNTTSQGFGFQPDLVWQKNRTSAANNILVDSVRGGSLYLISNTTGADASAPGYMTFNSNGVSFTSSSIDTNQSGQNYVAWQWRAGGTSSTNTSGTITSTVSVNTTAGFSIATYTGTGSAGTIGHGLGATPNMIIVKARSLAGRNWSVYHSVLGPTYVTWLNLTSASSNVGRTGYWNNTSPTSTVFTVGSDNDTNANTYTYIAYCWAAISGYSAFGSYTGNGSTDGPFVYTGFKPKYIMWKNTSTSSTEWIIQDTARQTYNAAPNNSYNLSADSSAKENDATVLGGPTNANNIDWLSNGFKIRYNNGNCNTNGNVYIYAAFAENPFKYALAQ